MRGETHYVILCYLKFPTFQLTRIDITSLFFISQMSDAHPSWIWHRVQKYEESLNCASFLWKMLKIKVFEPEF